MSERFFRSGPAPDDRYCILRDATISRVVEARAFVESLWSRTADYLDTDVVKQAGEKFFPRFWEMYLAGALLESGVQLVTCADRERTSEGPDLLIRGDRRIWIEAVTASAGTGADAVPDYVFGSATQVPDKEIILRLRNAIDEKHRKYKRYRTIGVVGEAEPFVVAINAALVPHARYEITLPRIVRSVLPFGHEFVRFDLERNVFSGGGFEFQDKVEKISGKPVATDLFLDPDYAGVSAVLYSSADELNHPEQVGADFVVVHNPLALNPIPKDWLPFWREYWVENEVLRCTDRLVLG